MNYRVNFLVVMVGFVIGFLFLEATLRSRIFSQSPLLAAGCVYIGVGETGDVNYEVILSGNSEYPYLLRVFAERRPSRLLLEWRFHYPFHYLRTLYLGGDIRGIEVKWYSDASPLAIFAPRNEKLVPVFIPPPFHVIELSEDWVDYKGPGVLFVSKGIKLKERGHLCSIYRWENSRYAHCATVPYRNRYRWLEQHSTLASYHESPRTLTDGPDDDHTFPAPALSERIMIPLLKEDAPHELFEPPPKNWRHR